MEDAVNTSTEITEVKPIGIQLSVANSEELKAEIKSELESIARQVQPSNNYTYHVDHLDISDETVATLAKERTKQTVANNVFWLSFWAIAMTGVCYIFKSSN